MIRPLVAWWTGRLYLHPPKRARQIGRRWLAFGLVMLAAFLVLLALHVSWAFIVGGLWVIGVGESMAHRYWADGWEARDKRAPR